MEMLHAKKQAREHVTEHHERSGEYNERPPYDWQVLQAFRCIKNHGNKKVSAPVQHSRVFAELNIKRLVYSHDLILVQCNA
jgi:hypothetical protein